MRRQPPIPPVTGISLKPQHYAAVLDLKPDVGFFEVHTENYMGAGGPPHYYLEAVRRDWALSMHGVGLSLGSADGLDSTHLDRVAAVVDRYQPVMVSEHLSWSAIDGVYLNDLVALPYTEEALDVICRNVTDLQDRLQRQVLMENPSAYLRYDHTPIVEPEFMTEMVQRTGCGVLLDVNNVYVSACNLGGDPYHIIDAMPAHAVGEIHVAGHHVAHVDGVEIRIDDHGSPVTADVWDLYAHALARTGDVPTLVEWDTDVPDMPTLLAEAALADDIRSGLRNEGGQDASVA